MAPSFAAHQHAIEAEPFGTETHVSLILEHVKLTIRRLDAYIVGYETSVYTDVANRIRA